MQKLCYVIPKYDARTEEHFLHTYTFLRELSKECELAIIIERCNGSPDFPGAKLVYAQRMRLPLLRELENFTALLYARLSGFDRLYVHYSFRSCIAGSLIYKLTLGKSFYWNCGLAKKYFRNTLSDFLANQLPLKLSLALCDFVVTGTPRMARYYEKEFGVQHSKALIVPNDIDLSRFKSAKSARGGSKVLFVHRLSVRKGALNLIPIIKRVAGLVPSARFIIAGDGPQRKELEEGLSAMGLAERTEFLGWVPNREVQKLFSQASVFIMPSEEEGFPRVLLEAQAAGVPFVATDVGGVRDIVGKEQQEFVVEYGDWKAFGAKVAALLKDANLRERLAKSGLQNVRKYSLPNVMEQFKNKVLYSE